MAASPSRRSATACEALPRALVESAGGDRPGRGLGRARPNDLAGSGDDLVADDVVARQAELPGQPAHAAAQGQAADTRVRHIAGRSPESVLLRRPIQLAELRAATDPRAPAFGIDP